MKSHGKIQKLLLNSGYIMPNGGGAPVFFQRSNVSPDTFARLSPEQPVAFEMRTKAKGKQEAIDLVIELPETVAQPMPSGPPAVASTPAFEESGSNQPAPATELTENSPLPQSESTTEIEPEVVVESEETIRRSKHGKVRDFDAEKGWGFVTPDEGGRGLFVHRTSIRGLVGFKTLFPGEAVLFDDGESERGPCAVNVRLVSVPVFNGKIVNFDEEEGEEGEEWRGLIQPNGGADPVAFRSSGIADKIVDKDYSDYDKGEMVKYRLVESAEGPVAMRVARLDHRPPLESFADLSNLDRLLPSLALKTAKEEWNFRICPDTQFPYPILGNYLFHTFKRIKQEEKIVFEKDQRGDRIACFNTGLATAKQEEIYAFFRAAKRKIQIEVSKSMLETEWVLAGFFCETEGPMVDIPQKAELASYFEGDAFKNLVFDHDLSFRVRRKHCLEDRRDRFLAIRDLPPSLKDDPEALGERFDRAVEAARRRVRRNYKTAIPTFNRGKINLLLPLCIAKKDRADLALLVVRHSNYDKTVDFYIGWTVLTLDQAYNNARLLARPDTEWLTGEAPPATGSNPNEDSVNPSGLLRRQKSSSTTRVD